jgi:hypothetical protein
MTLTLDIKDSAFDKIIYFLSHLGDDVKVVNTLDQNIEAIEPADSDYAFIMDARLRRADGEKCYSLDEITKELK